MVRDMHSSRRHLLAGTALTGVILAFAGAAAANPVNPTVVHGTVGFDTTGSVLEVRQGSDKAIIDWRGFDIAAGETTRFVQPGTGSIALNRVTGGQVSTIDGSLTGNGRIFLINPNGILFGAGSVVDVGSLVATTAGITNERFIAGDYRFDSASTVAGATITNNGTITASSGLAALVAPHVRNTGTIRAELGRVTLGAAQRFTLDLTGDGLISFDAGSAVSGAKLEQAGLVQGGSMLLSASTAARVVDNVIDMTGIVQAHSVRQDGGDIILDGGQGGVSVSGTLDAGTGTVRANTDLSLSGNVLGGSVTLAGALTVGDLATIVTAGAATDSVNVAGAIDGAGFLTIDAGTGSVSLGTVGASQALAGLAAKGSTVTLNGVRTSGRQDIAGAVTLSGDLVSMTGGAIRLAGPVTLATDSTIVTAGFAGDDVQITGAINGAHALVADAGTGKVTLGGAIGATSALMLLSAGGATVSVGDVTTTGQQDYAGTITLSGALASTIGGTIRLGGPVTLAGDSAIVTAGNGTDDIRIAGPVNGAYGLLVDAGRGKVMLDGAVGATSALKLFSAGGSSVSLRDVTTTGLQDYAGALTLNGDLASTVGGTIRLGGPVTLAGNSAIVSAGAASDDIRIQGTVDGPYALVADAGAGKLTLGGPVGATRALTLLSAGGSTVTLGDITTSGAQDYAGTIRLNGNLVSTTGGAIRIAGTTQLTGNSAIVTAGAAIDDIRITGPVDGPYALVLDAGTARVDVVGAVGATRALSSFAVGGGSLSLRGVTTTGLQDHAGALTLSGDLVSTLGGSIRVGGPVTLAGDSAIVTAGAATDDIRVNGTINGAYALVVDAGRGKVALDGTVGGTSALKLLSVGGSTIALRGLKTTGQQDYAGILTLNGDLTSTGGGTIRLAGPVTLASDSTITTAGAATDNVAVTGALSGPYRLTVRAGTGAVGLNGVVTGLSGLDVAGGTVAFATPVSVTNALIVSASRLSTGTLAAASITLSGTDVLTAGAITASQDVRVTAGKGAALANVAGRNVTVTAGDTLTTGAITSIQDTAITGAKAVTLGSVTARNLTATAGTNLTLAGVTGQGAVLTAGTRIASTGTLSLSNALVLETAGTVTGLDVRVGSLTYRGTGRFAASGTVVGVSGTDAADLIRIDGTRSGTYLFADRPVFGMATLVERHRLDLPLADTVPADEGDVRTTPFVLDPASVKDDLISFAD
ncbi:beta strand repeat-containing protein [Niveispirillum sp. KHB5.9]|uniref:beta strand repeat-containing protein n=1 Tax=Niveispirillum sp. KHB5.9 TaxID=3400269 RepID=UPI003A852D0D